MLEENKHYKINKDTGCWDWLRYKNKGGYGRGRYLGKICLAHRSSYEYHVEPIPKGMLVCHTCDNPPCINPEHLFLGTSKDNAIDMIKKGRNNYKVTKKEVLEIRKLHKEKIFKVSQLASLYFISQSHTYKIINNERRINEKYSKIRN